MATIHFGGIQDRYQIDALRSDNPGAVFVFDFSLASFRTQQEDPPFIKRNEFNALKYNLPASQRIARYWMANAGGITIASFDELIRPLFLHKGVAMLYAKNINPREIMEARRLHWQVTLYVQLPEAEVTPALDSGGLRRLVGPLAKAAHMVFLKIRLEPGATSEDLLEMLKPVMPYILEGNVGVSLATAIDIRRFCKITRTLPTLVALIEPKFNARHELNVPYSRAMAHTIVRTAQ